VPEPVRIVLAPDDCPLAKGALCAQAHGHNLHAASRVAANDEQGRLTLCRYVLRPPLDRRVGSRPALPAADHRGKVWKPSQGFHVDDRLHLLPMGAVRLDFKRPWSDGTNSVDLDPLALIGQVVPAPATSPTLAEKTDKPAGKSHYIPWRELLKRTFAIDIVCSKCHSPPARPPPRETKGDEDWLN
jgi:hypothetical protein